VRPLAAVALLLLLGACSDDTPAGPTSSTSSSTTTIVDDTCERVADDTVVFVEALLDELDETRLVEFRERGDWPDDLVRLERLGTDLDIRVRALRCDATAIRDSVLQRADLASSGPLSEGIVAFLLSPPEPAIGTEPTAPGSTTAP
jgi:hypothetical protein